MGTYFRMTLVLLFTFILQSSGLSQGKLFTKEAADKEFGPVLKSIEIPVSTLSNLTTLTTNHLMFKIKNNQVIVLGKDRRVLYPSSTTQVNSDEVFTVFSLSVINELLSNGTGSSVIIEQRRDVLSITYGNMTLEYGVQCPPFCS